MVPFAPHAKSNLERILSRTPSVLIAYLILALGLPLVFRCEWTAWCKVLWTGFWSTAESVGVDHRYPLDVPNVSRVTHHQFWCVDFIWQASSKKRMLLAPLPKQARKSMYRSCLMRQKVLLFFFIHFFHAKKCHSISIRFCASSRFGNTVSSGKCTNECLRLAQVPLPETRIRPTRKRNFLLSILSVVFIKYYFFMNISLVRSRQLFWSFLWQIEILCCGCVLGAEYTLDFINRTRWRDPSSRLVLTYRTKPTST